MLQSAKPFLFASFLLCVPLLSATAAEREDVRKVINLVTSVKMPYPETLSRSRSRTERVWLERDGLTVGCIRLEERRWCYEHIAPNGNRAEMLRIRNEPSRGVYIDALFYYMVDFDLDGLIDVGSTTEIEAVGHRKSNQQSTEEEPPNYPQRLVVKHGSLRLCHIPGHRDRGIDASRRPWRCRLQRRRLEHRQIGNGETW